MDITIKVKKDDTWVSHTFVGDKEQILPDMQKYIKDNEGYYIDVFFSSEEEAKELTYDELFNPK